MIAVGFVLVALVWMLAGVFRHDLPKGIRALLGLMAPCFHRWDGYYGMLGNLYRCSRCGTTVEYTHLKHKWFWRLTRRLTREIY